MSRSLRTSRHRIGVLLIALMLLAMVGIAPTSAITNGGPDGTDHPFVGSIVIQLSDGEVLQACSGTLLEGGWFLTASHCLEPIPYWTTERFPGSTVKVTFDPTISETGTFYAIADYTIHPLYGLPAASDAHDVGLIELETWPSVTPAELPVAGLLDELKADHVLKDTLFTTVGYGTIRDTQQGGFANILDNLDRNVAVQGFHSLTKAWVRLPMTASTGDGGTCYGDSGGPHFVWLDGEETSIVASITVTGDAPCKALDTTYRIDTVSTLAFLAETMDS